MSKLLHVVYLGVILALLFAWLQVRSSEPVFISVPVVQESPVVESSIRPVQAQIGSYTDEDLLQQVELLTQANAELMALIESQDEVIAELEQDFVVLRREAERSESNATNQASTPARRALGRVSPIDLDNIDDVLASEDIDADWAYEMDMNIRNIFRGDTPISGVLVQNVDCRTVTCRITLNRGDYSGATLGRDLHMQMRESGWFNPRDYTYVTMHSNDSTDVQMILVRRDPNAGSDGE
ncbi:MAG: hypothetical protein JJU10_10340 [Idiomarina sp.]|nr:hypothetical protein [Idiomarina sp.]